MAIIAAGSSQTLTVPAGKTVTGSGNGVAALLTSPRLGQQVVLQGPSWTLGPFPADQQVNFSAQQDLNLSFDGQPLKSLVSNRTVMCGDSITSLGNFPGPDGRWNEQGHVKWADFFLNGRLDIVYNAGIPGNRTADLLARIDTDVISWQPDYVVEMCGSNDIAAPLVNGVPTDGGVVAGLPAATIAAAVRDTVAAIIRNKTAYYVKMLAANIQVFSCSITPSSGWVGFQHARDIWAQVREWQRNYCLTTPGMTYVDLATTMVDPQSAASAPRNIGIDNDGLHFYARSAIAAGRALADAMAPIVPISPNPLFVVDAVSTNNPGGNLIPNVRWDGTGGTIIPGVTVTGTVPDGWQVNAVGTGTPPAVTITKVAHPDIPGAFVLQLAVTFAAVPDFQGFEIKPIAALALVGAAAGDLIDYDFEFRIVSNNDHARGFGVYATDFDAGFGVLGNFGMIPNTITLPMGPMATLGRFTSGRRPGRLGVGTTFRFFKIEVYNNANNAGSITFQLGRLSMRKRLPVSSL